MRSRLIAAGVVTLAALTPASPAQAADVFRRCAGITADGVLDLRSKNLPCASARALAQRTLDVKCFLDERTCRHGFRGRRWTCTVSVTFESVRCTSGARRVTWRNPT